VSAPGFFLLIGLAIVARWLGLKLVPLVIPRRRLRTLAIGWLGALTGSLMDRYIWHLGPKFVEIQVAAAAIGCTLFILAAGLWPFLRILAGQTGARRA
jgi:hypothetical protein